MYKQNDTMYYYDFKSYVKVKLLTNGKKLKRFPGVYFFKVKVIDNTHWKENDRMPTGKTFNPNSSTCFYTKKEQEEHHSKTVKFWKLSALAEMKAIATGKMKPKSFFEI